MHSGPGGAESSIVSLRVAVLDDYQQVASSCASWTDLGPDVEVRFLTEHLVGDPLIETLADVEVVVAMRERTAFPAEVIDRLPALRLLVTTGMGNVAIDIPAAERAGVVVCGTGHLLNPTAELTWAMILSLTRHLRAEEAALRAGLWQATLGEVIGGKTLGVVGLGHLGQRVARVGLAFDMRVLAWSTNLDPEVAATHGVQAVSKAELLAESDVVSLHLKLSERSRGTIGAAELQAMKPSAYLVNTSRGPLVDTDALIQALRAGWIAGAGIDVFDEEPLPADHPLLQAPRTLLTPHIGYVVDRGYELYYGDVVEDISAWLAGRPVRVLG